MKEKKIVIFKKSLFRLSNAFVRITDIPTDQKH